MNHRSQRKYVGSLLIGMLCIGLLLSSAQASIILQLSDQQMVQKASRIVRGKVVRKYSQWVKAERRIYTYIIVAVLDTIKGSPGSEITIRQVGGSANGLGMHVPGTASFQLGEEVFVFLEKARRSSHYLVMGMSFGKYRVLTDAKTQNKTLHRDLHGISLASWNKQKKMQIKHASPEMVQPKKLETFVQQLRGYLQPVVATPSVPTPQVKNQPLPRVKVPQPTTPQPTLPRK